MKKDLKSYEQHNSEYLKEWNSYDNNIKIIEKYDHINLFKNLGFEYAIRMSNPLPETHIDIGSGNGWLVRKTSPFFKKVIGIEPSKAIIEVASKINKDNHNVSFVNTDMIDGLQQLSINEPVFITTATVLNHIENYYVKEFLSHINNLPIGSTLFFDERYDKNIDWKLWHVRNKDWWIKNLPKWQLFFCNFEIGGYSSGIFGICVGENNILASHNMGTFSKVLWGGSRLFNIIDRVMNKTTKLKVFFKKIATYFRNKFYNFIFYFESAINAPKKIKNYQDFIKAKKKGAEAFTVNFTDGYKILCNTNEDFTFLETCVNEDYTKKLGVKINKGDIVFDIGAHVGSFSMYAASKGAIVYAFEPDPINYGKLRKNIELNNFQNLVIPFNHAITDKNGTIQLSQSKTNTGGHSLYVKTDDYVTVETYSMEESMSMAQVNHIDLLKIDTEGAEYTILPSIKTETYKKIKKIVGEYHIIPELPGKNYWYLKKILSPHFKYIKHRIPYYFYCSK